MEELKTIAKLTDEKLEIVKPIDTSLVFLGSVMLKNNHTCFEINLKTLDVVPAEYTSIVNYDQSKIGNFRKSKKVVIKDDCYYINALNKKNALKKFIKIFNL